MYRLGDRRRPGQITACLIAIFWTAACAGSPTQADLAIDLPFHLEDHLDAATIIGSEAPEALPEPVEWRFDEPQPDWKPVVTMNPNTKPVKVERTDDALRLMLDESNHNLGGDPVGGIVINLPEWSGNDWGSVVVHARSSEGIQGFDVGFNTRSGEPSTSWSPYPFEYGQGADAVNDGSVQTYVLQELGGSDRWGTWNRLGLWVYSNEPAIFEVLSVSVIPMGAEYADAPVGVKAESHRGRRTLYSHAPGRLEYEVRVPEAGRLDLGLGVLRNTTPVTFEVTATGDDGEVQTLLEETYDDPTGWAQRSVDVSHLAGQTVTLTLGADAQQPGTVALWARPTLSGTHSMETYTNFIGMEFQRIPAGSFQMGFEGQPLDSESTECYCVAMQPDVWFEATEGLYNEIPAHPVTISDDFYIGTYEVTIGEYQQYDPDVRARYGAEDPRSDEHPVYRVTWDEADAFSRWLTENDPDGHTYRLPTEAEWEYAARAGTTTPFYTGRFLDPWGANLGSWNQWKAEPVGLYAANPWGLYDMHGNAEEWVLDWYGPYSDDASTDPAGYSTGDIKVIRGLSDDVFAARSATRGGFPPTVRVATRTGFRVVISDARLNFRPAAHADGSESRSDVATSRPVPGTIVAGETFAVEEGHTFSRVAMTRAFYPTQKDEAVYVSEQPIQGEAGRGRAAAGLFARDLSLTYGVLFRIANKYELNDAGMVSPPEDAFFLTIIPDVKYQEGLPHPDVSYHETRWTKPYREANGPLYTRWNMSLAVEEAPNGDLLSTWSTGSETSPVNTLVMARLRWGEREWDAAEFLVDVPFRHDVHNALFNNGRGRLFSMWPVSIVRFSQRAMLQRYSDDSGVSWSPIQVIGQGGRFLVPSKTILAEKERSLVAATAATGFIHSADDGLSWQSSRPDPAIGSSHVASALVDDGSLLILRQTRNGPATMEEVRTRDLGATWSLRSAPFNQQVSTMIKLHSGRLLLFTYGNDGIAIAESVDQGETWFSRSKHDVPALGYADATQGRDGIVHFMGEVVDEQGRIMRGRQSSQGSFPLFSFSEQWLREQTTCLDVSEWGVEVPGRIASCPPESDDYIGLKAAGG